MLELVLASMVAAGTCARDEALRTEDEGDFVVCNQTRIPQIAQTLARESGWLITVTNPKACKVPLRIRWQVISGDAGLIELLERIETDSGAIKAKLDTPSRRATITCLF